MSDIVVPDNIKRLKPYIPGKPVEELERELGITGAIKIASNENPLGPSPKVVEAIREAASRVHFYPEGAAPVLREAVASHLDVDPKHLIFGNGSDEILLLLVLTLISDPADEIVIGDPSFAMYDIYATTANATTIKVPLKNYTHDLPAMADRVTSRTKLMFIANPNNPTGTLVGRDEIARLIERVPDHVTIVLDEAYYEFVDPAIRPETIRYVLEGRNVVVTRTFSKAYALAGMRVGYAIAPLQLAGYMDRVRSPFNVNLVAQAAAAAALTDTEHLRKSIEVNSAGRRQLEQGLAGLGLAFVPSAANFVLVDVSNAEGRDSVAVYNALLHKGVIVRPCASFGLPNHIRVSVGTEAEIARFLKTMSELPA